MNKKYIIAISFANYLKDKSGVPKVMMAHQLMYNENQISYVAIFSVKKCIFNNETLLFCKYGLIIDGEYKGIFQMSQLIHLFYKWWKNGKILLDIHIHHFMFTKINLINELLNACPCVPIKVYLHDYYNACTGYNLLKNGDNFCGGEGFSEEKCKGCVFAESNKRVQNKIHMILHNNIKRITFVSPSQVTKNIFLKFHPEYIDRTIVIPHQKYDELYKDNLDEIGEFDKIRVAFLGMPRRFKGWNIWKELVDTAPEANYEFTVFNSSVDSYPNMKKIQVSYSKENLNAMTDALRRYKVHIAILWSICPETYSYTCFEAFSANAFIITNLNSGNIADVVRQHRNGVVLSNEEELKELFLDVDKMRSMINAYRRTSEGGPEHLYENNEIVKLTLQDNGAYEVLDSNKIVNYPLLWLLNRKYNK
jgi:hypothetical protein